MILGSYETEPVLVKCHCSCKPQMQRIIDFSSYKYRYWHLKRWPGIIPHLCLILCDEVCQLLINRQDPGWRGGSETLLGIYAEHMEQSQFDTLHLEDIICCILLSVFSTLIFHVQLEKLQHLWFGWLVDDWTKTSWRYGKPLSTCFIFTASMAQWDQTVVSPFTAIYSTLWF